ATRLLVVFAPVLYAQRLGGGDLHVIHVLAGPNRGRVWGWGRGEGGGLVPPPSPRGGGAGGPGPPQKLGGRRGVGPRALQVAPERLLDNDARPARSTAAAVDQAVLCEIVDDRGVEARGGREVKETIAVAAMLLVHLAQPLAELLIACGTLEVGREVMKSRQQLVP